MSHANERPSPLSPEDRTEAFVRLFAVYQRRIYAHIFALVPNRADAEDIFQETSAVLWRKFRQYEPGTNFGAWACRIAHYEVLSHRRRKPPELLVLEDSLLEVVSRESEARSDEIDQRYGALIDCIQRLRPKDRELLVRRYRSGATVKSVAEQMGRSVQGLHKTYQRIRRTLFECVERAVARECRP